MKQIAACLLVAVGIDAAGYCADKTLVPQVASCFDVSADMPDLTPDFISSFIAGTLIPRRE